jgi:hypothetical protein
MDIDYNTQCYTFKKKTYTKGFLDESVDATYILHLKDNGRLEHIHRELLKYQPTKTVYIVYNEGFKKCKKKLIEQISYQDLTDAFLQSFKHANEHHYNNVLILEDDFMFNSEIREKKHLKSINTFLNDKKHEEFIYYLGCNPILIRPYTYDFNHYISYKSCSMHSIVYSREARNKTKNLQLKHWDVIVENSISNKYLYYKPLCYQIYGDTENKKSWSEKDNIIIFHIKNFIIKKLYLDKQPEPGFTYLYILAKLISILITILLICIIVYLIKLLRKNK